MNIIESKLPHDETGRCAYLVDTVDPVGRDISVCSVYEIRESLGCSTSSSLMPEGMDWRLFFKITAVGCNVLQEAEGLDESYRVRVGDE